MGMIWANSGDSHFLEPEDLWQKNLPAHLAELMPRSEKDPDGKHETVHVDGQSFRRRLPNPKLEEFREASSRPPGARDAVKRLDDLDAEGIWGEVVFPSLGMWNASFRTPEALREAIKVSNDFAHAEIMKASPRLVPTAQVSQLSIEDAVAELERTAAMGFKVVFLPTAPPAYVKDYHHDEWEPFWAACEAANMIIAFHIGSDPVEGAGGGGNGHAKPGAGGARRK
jgi:predicted TIM-barrel fold metal-dependent hydrolase